MSAYDDLLEERYGRSPWWETPAETPDDSETTTARRRRLMDADFRAAEREGVA